MFGTGSASAASASAAAASAAAGAAAAKNYAGYSLHRNTTSSHGGSTGSSSYNNYYRPTAHYGWVAPQPWVPVPQSAPVLTESLAATPSASASALPQDFYRGSRLRTGAAGVATAVPVIAPLVAAAAAMPPVALPVLATSSTRPLPVDADDEPFRYCPSPRMFPTATTSSMAVSVAHAACASSNSGAHPLLQFSSSSTGTLLPPTVGCSQPMADVSSNFNIQALSSLLQRCHDRSSNGSPTQHSLTE